MAQLAAAGDVEAPTGALIGAAAVATAVALASTFAFKSGFEAQEDIANRDKKIFGKAPKRPQK